MAVCRLFGGGSGCMQATEVQKIGAGQKNVLGGPLKKQKAKKCLGNSKSALLGPSRQWNPRIIYLQLCSSMATRGLWFSENTPCRTRSGAPEKRAK